MIAFENKYEENFKKVKEIPLDWGEKVLLNSIESCEESKNEKDPRKVLKLLKSTAISEDDVYILGPKSTVNGFCFFEYGMYRKFKGIIKYPFAQGTREGYIYTKEQNYLIIGVQLDSYFSYGREPYLIAKFPTVQWDSKIKYIKPNPKCDVFYSAHAVDDVIHNLLQYSLAF